MKAQKMPASQKRMEDGFHWLESKTKIVYAYTNIGAAVCRYQIPATRTCWSGDHQSRRAVTRALEMYKPSWGRSLEESMHRFERQRPALRCA